MDMPGPRMQAQLVHQEFLRDRLAINQEPGVRAFSSQTQIEFARCRRLQKANPLDQQRELAGRFRGDVLRR